MTFVPFRIGFTHLLLLCGVLVASSSGCVATGSWWQAHIDMHELRRDLHEDRRDLKEELAEVRQEQRLALRESELSAERAHLEETKRCLPESAPLVESTIAMPLRQKFVLGAPELDVEAMRERLKLEEQNKTERLNDWRQKMVEWKQRKAFHEEQEARRIERFRENGGLKQQCGCSAALACGHCCCSAEQKGQCGCDKALACGHCCCKKFEEEKTCEFAPLKSQPFTEKPPEMPREAVMASDIPLKINLRMISDIGDSRISKVRTGREAIEELPRAPLNEGGPCDSCTDRAGACADKPVGKGAAAPPPVYYDSPSTVRALPPAPVPDTDRDTQSSNTSPPSKSSYPTTRFPGPSTQPVAHPYPVRPTSSFETLGAPNTDFMPASILPDVDRRLAYYPVPLNAKRP